MRPSNRSRARGRIDVVAVFDGGSVRFKTDPKRSVPAAEVVKTLREWAGYIEKGVQAEKRKSKVAAGSPPHA
jgi:hypothetical protein